MAGAVPTLFFVAAGLLAWSGVGKVRRPEATVSALAALRLPGERWAAQMLGAFELALGTWCLIAPSAIVAAVLAIAYAAFASVVATQLTAGRTVVSSCGCFGGHPTPPSWLHVGVDMAAAVVAVLAATGPRLPGLGRSTVDLGLAGPAYVAGLAAAVALTAVVASSLPAALSSYRGRREAHS